MKDKASLAHRSELNCKHPQSYWKITIRSLKEVGFAICPVWLWYWEHDSSRFHFPYLLISPFREQPWRRVTRNPWCSVTSRYMPDSSEHGASLLVFAKRPGKALRTQGWQTTLAGFLPSSLRYIQPILHSGQPEEEMTQLGTYGHGSFKEIFPVFSYHCVHVWII